MKDNDYIMAEMARYESELRREIARSEAQIRGLCVDVEFMRDRIRVLENDLVNVVVVQCNSCKGFSVAPRITDQGNVETCLCGSSDWSVRGFRITSGKRFWITHEGLSDKPKSTTVVNLPNES